MNLFDKIRAKLKDFEGAIKIINEIEAEYSVPCNTCNHTNGWILSSEKLPEIGQMCVCHVNRENYPNVRHDFIICEYVFDSHIRRWKDWFIDWMPILRPANYIQDRMLLIDDAIKEMEGE